MRAVILLRTNPGAQKKAYMLLKDISRKGIEIESQIHCFGRFDGVITCKFDNLKSLNAFTETLREAGIFHTETLTAID